MKYRTEFDSIGKIKVPGDKYWGASTERSNKYFNIGDFLVRPIVIRSIAVIKKAAAITNAKNKDLDPKLSKYIVKAASQGLAVILITHNVHHAYPVGNSFTVLNRGKSLGTYEKKDISREKLLSMMAGGEELDKLEVELKEMNRISS